MPCKRVIEDVSDTLVDRPQYYLIHDEVIEFLDSRANDIPVRVRLWMAKDAATAAPKTPSTVVSSQLNWIQLDKPLPDFEISDAEGKSWRLADLKGKVTLVNLWATWCGPCRSELPYLQKLFNKVRERKDLAVVTLNTDDNPGLILPFLNENKYTFPVLPAAGYVAKLVPELSIPRNWIVDADGLLRKERVGFGNGDDKWVDEMIETMEKARGK